MDKREPSNNSAHLSPKRRFIRRAERPSKKQVEFEQVKIVETILI